MPTEWSRLDTWAVSTWRVFEPDQDYGLIYPLHESCLDIIRQLGLRRSLQVENGSRIPSGLGDYFEALLRLHVRNTTTPNGGISIPDIPPTVWSGNITAMALEKCGWGHGA